MQQLGMGDLHGVPSLLTAILPDDTSTLPRRWMRQLLLQPPEPSVALAIQNCCRLLKGVSHIDAGCCTSHTCTAALTRSPYWCLWGRFML